MGNTKCIDIEEEEEEDKDIQEYIRREAVFADVLMYEFNKNKSEIKIKNMRAHLPILRNFMISDLVDFGPSFKLDHQDISELYKYYCAREKIFIENNDIFNAFNIVMKDYAVIEEGAYFKGIGFSNNVKKYVTEYKGTETFSRHKALIDLIGFDFNISDSRYSSPV